MEAFTAKFAMMKTSLLQEVLAEAWNMTGREAGLICAAGLAELSRRIGDDAAGHFVDAL